MFKFNKRFNKRMSERDNLAIRLSYLGGKKADDRMALDKLKTLKKALLYSYQAETAILEDGREFRCLINPDKLKNDYDNKIISIPYYDICLNKEKQNLPTWQAEEEIGLKVGDVFEWKETGSRWIIYLQYLEESAYFRAEIRKCTGVLTLGDKEYPAYIRGPVETTIRWNQKSDITWNDLNYSKIAYIKEDDSTREIQRFDVIKVDGQNYQVQAVNKDTASDGIMIIYLKEYFTNTVEEEIKEENTPEPIISEIQGPQIVYPYDIKTYTINDSGGSWSLSNKKARISVSNETSATIEIVTGKAGVVDLSYTKLSGETIVFPIEIKSL